MDTRLFHKRLSESTIALIPERTAIVCAVSGGLDSMALLHGLIAVNQIHDRQWNLRIAHLDHRLRNDSAADADFVAQQAKQLYLPCDVEIADVQSHAEESGETLEEAARRIRYAFLTSIAERCGAQLIATAHHADDQAETVLYRLLRGTSLRGLAGMPPCRPIHTEGNVKLVRPLLAFTRQELAAYVEVQGIAFRHDASNDDVQAATRNRIRHELLPLLREKFNPDIIAAINRLALHARRADDAFQLMAADALKHASVQESTGQIRISAAFLQQLPAAVQSQLVMMCLHRMDTPLGDISLERIDAILALISGDGHRRLIELPKGTTVKRRGRFIIFRAKNAPSESEDITMIDQGARS